MASNRESGTQRVRGAVRPATRRTRLGSSGIFLTLPHLRIPAWFPGTGGTFQQRTASATASRRITPITGSGIWFTRLRRRFSNWAWGSIVSMLLLMALTYSLNYLLTTPELTVKTVQVSGTQLLQPDQVVRSSGTLGSNIFLVNTQQVLANLTAQKAIHSATVQLRLPNEVLISVEERPAAFVWKVGDTMYAVSKEGYVIGIRKQVEGVIGIVDVDAVAVKQNDQIDPKVLVAARQLWDVLPKRAKITPSYFEYSHTQGLILPNGRGGRIIFGDADNLDAKLANLNGVLQKLEQDQKQAKMIDLRNIERPYMRW